jgi:radical SAM superfamily enzyme YgiQ (UPF0313 family)
VNRVHAKELLRAVARENIRWFTESDVSVANDPELLRMMREAGCAQVLIGFESPSRRALHGLEQKRNWKQQQWSVHRSAIERIQRHGITVNGCFVMGLDGCGPESFDEVHEFVRESGLYDVQITFMTAFPGTPLYERLLASGRILQPEGWDRCTLFDINFQPTDLTVAELRHGFEELARKIYAPNFVRERERRFVNQYRMARKEARRAA